MGEVSQLVVLDASAILAVAFDEAGSENVVAHFGYALAPTTVMIEVLAKIARKGIPLRTARADLEGTGLRWYVLGPDASELAADHLLRFRDRGISLADSTCLALAHILSAPVLTADREWATLGLSLDIRLIR
jgi:PIN domain nuclease of toxin-antitoxin system